MPPEGPQDGPVDEPGDGPDAGSSDGDRPESSSVEGPDAATPEETTSGPSTDGLGSSSREQTAGAGRPYRVRLMAVAGTGAGEAGKRSRARTTTGRRVGAATTGGTGLHLAETIRAAAPYQHGRGRSSGRLRFEDTDLRQAIREGREANLVLFCVDASGSMAARKRMQQVKTAILSLLLDAYQRRDKVGLVTFRAGEASVVLPPTSSIDVAATRLEELPTGGRTPLAEGLLEAADVIRRERLRDPRRRALLVVVTDGRATDGADAVARAQQAAAFLAEGLSGTGRAPSASALVVDCESGPLRLGLARDLAVRLHAEHLPLAEVSAEALTGAVRTRGVA